MDAHQVRGGPQASKGEKAAGNTEVGDDRGPGMVVANDLQQAAHYGATLDGAAKLRRFRLNHSPADKGHGQRQERGYYKESAQ